MGLFGVPGANENEGILVQKWPERDSIVRNTHFRKSDVHNYT